MKSFMWRTHENCEESCSLTLRTRNLRRPSRMLARNWKHQLLLLCLARQARTVNMVRPVVNPMRSNQNLRASWKPVNPQDCVWENLYRIIMKTMLQERVTNHCNIRNWYTNFSYASSHEDSFSKGSSGKIIGKLGENFGVEPDESQK